MKVKMKLSKVICVDL